MSSHALESSDFGLPNDPTRPVLSALSRAFLENYNAFRTTVTKASDLDTQSPGKIDVGRMVRLLEEAHGFLTRAKELMDWIYPSVSALSLENGMQIANRMQQADFPREWVQAVIKGIGRKKAGRPSTKRCVAIQAKELKLTDPKRWSWPKITAVLCDCGKDHDIRCQNNLRREVLHLEKIMRECGCKI